MIIEKDMERGRC